MWDRGLVRIGGAAGLGLVILPLFLAAACGGSSGGSGSSSSGLSSSKRLIDLTDPEKGQLCDWMVGKAGSYGTPGTCDETLPPAMFPFLTYGDRAECIADSPDQTFTDCVATVAQLEACVNLLPACASLTDAASIPACAVLENC